jgi:hypothetical protein
MRLTRAQAGLLAHLAEGGSLPRSRIAKTLLPILQEAHVVRLERSGSSYLVRGRPDKIAAFAEHRWGIRDLRSFAAASPENRSRESIAEIAGDSKALPNHPLAGIFIRSFGNCALAQMPLAHTPRGSAIFISPAQLPKLKVAASTLIAIENPACLLSFEKALPHFPDLELGNIALVLRWSWGTAWREWLRRWQGAVFHFPDYDRAGLRIFATEVLRHRSDARLLIPADLKTLVSGRGNRKLFLRQGHLSLPNSNHPDIALVQAEIESSRKALEQEELVY